MRAIRLLQLAAVTALALTSAAESAAPAVPAGGAAIPAPATPASSTVPPARAAPNTAPGNAAQIATIKQTLQKRFPDIEILDVTPSPVPGLYEVLTEDTLAYATPTGDYLLVGSLMDTRTRQNLTKESMDTRNAIDFGTLPVAQAIKVVKGNGQRQIAVFADPDCPYCKKLEQEFASMTNVTVYTYLYPLDDLHPGARLKSHAIWCAKDRSQAWTQWMTEQKSVPPQASCKDDPLDQLSRLGKKLRINSTPTIFLASGQRISGLVPAAELEKMLSQPVKAAPVAR
jgi:thiol:disulfide interchange protein DsbC